MINSGGLVFTDPKFVSSQQPIEKEGCEFCRSKVKYSTQGATIGIELAFTNGYCLEVIYMNYDNGGASEECAEFDVNYCPMCGKKL